jgi:DNA polymerase-4
MNNKDDSLNWLLLDLNSFFASCEQQANPRLRGRPVGVVPMLGVDTTCLLAASQEAKQLGLKTGTSVREAKRICRDIVLIKASHKLYVDYHHKILAAIEKHLPIEQILSIDEMACRLTGSQRDLAKALQIARAIKETFRQEVGEYLTCSIGLAPNRLVAKIASNIKKPDGLIAIMPADLPQALYSLPLEAIPGVGHNMLRRLHEARIKDVKSLCTADPRYLRRIWGGVTGVRTWAQLNGVDVPPSAAPNKTVIGHQHVLEPEFRNPAGGYEVVHYLLAKATERLRKMEHTCRNLSVSVKMTDHYGRWSNECNFHSTNDTMFLLAQLKRVWESYPDHLNPLRVGVMLHGLIPLENKTDDLFSTDRPPQLFNAIDKVNTLFGRHTVTFGLNTYLRDKIGGDKIAFARVPEDFTLDDKL